MVGDAKEIEIGTMLDEIDRSSQQKAAIDQDGIRQTPRIAVVIVETEGELEVGGTPILLLGRLPDPDAEIAPQFIDFVGPYARNGRHQFLGVFRRDAIEHGIERPGSLGQRLAGDWQLPFLVERAIELRLHVVKQTAARQRIHPRDRLRLVPRLEPVDRGEKKLVGAGGVPLQRGERVRALTQTMARQRSLCAGRHLDEPVARRPRLLVAQPAAGDGPLQRLVQPEEIVGVTFHRRRVARVEQRPQR